MRIQILHFADCPNWQSLSDLVEEALDRLGLDSPIEFVTVDTPELARRWHFRGSPTLWLDGEDPFLDESAPIGLSCRLYRTPEGLRGTPDSAQLMTALTSAVGGF